MGGRSACRGAAAAICWRMSGSSLSGPRIAPAGEASIVRTRAAIAGHITCSKPVSAAARSASVAPAGSITIESGLIPARYASRKKSLMPFVSRLVGFTRTSSSRSRVLPRAVLSGTPDRIHAARSAARPRRGLRPFNAATRAAGSLRLSIATPMLNSVASASSSARLSATGSDDEQWRIEAARELEDPPAGRGVGRQRRHAVGEHLLIQLAKTANHGVSLARLQTGIERLGDLDADLLRVGQLDVRHAQEIRLGEHVADRQ